VAEVEATTDFAWFSVVAIVVAVVYVCADIVVPSIVVAGIIEPDTVLTGIVVPRMVKPDIIVGPVIVDMSVTPIPNAVTGIALPTPELVHCGGIDRTEVSGLLPSFFPT